ncbi:Asparagine--tRNA ligase [Vibrio cholerae]|nr:Asparagine--tRNA ligase [Vibrio cholerae]
MQIITSNCDESPTEINQFNIGDEVRVQGFVSSIRTMKWGCFVILRCKFGFIQCVFSSEMLQSITISSESYITINGVVKSASLKDLSLCYRNLEIDVKGIIDYSQRVESPPIDLTKQHLDINLDVDFNYRQYSLRHARYRSIFKVKSMISHLYSQFFVNKGFTQIHSPKIVSIGAEGGADVFKLNYFEKNAFLAQSPQFYKQMMVPVFGSVFEIAPVYRAEKHNTSRHVNEYVSLDIETELSSSMYELMEIQIEMLNYVFTELSKRCSYELEYLGVELPTLSEYIVLDFDDAHRLIFEKFGIDHLNSPDLAPEEERLICDYVKKQYDIDFVYIVNYPLSKRPFYTKANPDNPNKSQSFDLLFKGLEISTGGERLSSYDDYVSSMFSKGLDHTQYKEYLDTFKCSMPRHGGFGMGLERLVSTICNLSNVKEASLFPRDRTRITP